jgi:hypothetical protein
MVELLTSFGKMYMRTYWTEESHGSSIDDHMNLLDPTGHVKKQIYYDS